MRLAKFILDNLEPILLEWEAFALNIETPQSPLGTKGLRNHAEQILRTIARDLLTPQTAQQQEDKSRGLAPTPRGDTAAETHAVLRLIDGFTLDQMVSEYRALRASVLKLWFRQEVESVAAQVEDMMRFNEAVDQALGESITAYGVAVEKTRKTVLAVLGHDLRSPLTAVLMGGQLLNKRLPDATREQEIAAQITESAQRANHMIHDLLDLARCNLGIGLSISLEKTELSVIFRSIVDEVLLGHPKIKIVYDEPKKITGRFDPTRIAQVFSNLIVNAVRHGDSSQPIHVDLKEENAEVRFQVQNLGQPIPDNVLPHLFDPTGRYSSYSNEQPDRSEGLGLGLFIAAQIVEGHGGRIDVTSNPDKGTCFDVTLPVR